MARKNTNKQVRISNSHYDLINELAEKLDVNRHEVMSNAVALIKFLVDNNAISIKAICKDGAEKELMMTLLVGNWAK